MNKNKFLLYDDLIKKLYACNTLEDLKNNFLNPLRMLIPYSYSSIILTKSITEKNTQELKENPYTGDPVCIPDSFQAAEKKYIQMAEDDLLLWLTNVNESTILLESSLIDDKTRLNNKLYLNCYKQYNIYDNLQYSIVYNRKLLGVLTLFRTFDDEKFNSDEIFFLRTMGSHLNIVFNKIISQKNTGLFPSCNTLAQKYSLTKRESEILNLIFKFYNNDEIADSLDITENTVQKHIQNLLRKLNAGSKWDLMHIYKIHNK